ncbi:MAG: carbohydrate ABC transporter permease [Dermabacter sp.]|nr:carbohydrate ABC transporter permease [Dermabacter sp.]
MPTSRLRSAIVAYTILGAAVILTLGPLSLAVLTSLRGPSDFLRQGVMHLPDPLTLANYEELFTGATSFLTPFAVTGQMVAVILVGQIVFSTLAAYAFAFLRFPGRDAMFWVFVSTLMVPQVVVVVPLYLAFAEMGLRNTFWALVLPFVFGSPYAVFLLRENFRSMPQELLDAMRVDGAGHGRLLWNLIVPLNRPILVTLVVITVVTHWNSFIWPLVITSGPTWQTLTVATATLSTEHNQQWTVVMAATTLAMIPLILLYLVFQRQVARSIGGTELR